MSRKRKKNRNKYNRPKSMEKLVEAQAYLPAPIPVVIPDNTVEKYRWLFSKEQHELVDILPKMMEKYYDIDAIFAIDDFILVEGTIPICLVAHMDTVHMIKPTDAQLVYNPSGHSYSSPLGIGADDRAGIIAILEILEKGHRPHVLFTTDEEIGGLGADMFIHLFPKKFPFDLKYFIQIDRRGSAQAVFYDCENDLFELYINDFGFMTHMGSFTDIATFMTEYDIAGVNLSAGYTHEHTKVETLYVDGLDFTIKGIDRMLKDEENADHYTADVKDWYSGGSGVYNGGWTSGINYDYLTDPYHKGTNKHKPKWGDSVFGIEEEEESLSDDFHHEPINDLYGNKEYAALYGVETMICKLCGTEFQINSQSMYSRCTSCNVTQITE